MKKKIISILCIVWMALPVFAGTGNIAIRATATASSSRDSDSGPSKAIDGLIHLDNAGEWVSGAIMPHWQQLPFPWIQLDWEEEVTISRIILYDRPNKDAHTAGGDLYFSDGSRIGVVGIPNDGTPKVVEFEPKKVRWVKFVANDAVGSYIGLSEIEVYPPAEACEDFVSQVDPFIETTKGRYFFFITGNQPFGMIGAAPMTRNRNQFGGGYNYNFNEVLGFSQVNEWMVSGPNIMPVSGGVNPTQGMDGWKSEFKHESEIIQPGYHRLFLDRYKTWVEYTATDRVTFYRLNYTSDKNAKLLVDIGSVLGNCSMDKGALLRISDKRIVGEFMATERFWGGPDSLKLCFVLDCSVPIKKIDGWSEKGINPDVEAISGNNAGMVLDFGELEGSEVLFKIALSYTTVDNAIENLNTELSHWDFEKIRKDTRDIWNEMFGRIAVEGGSQAQHIKFYTDLWHALLGRHKITDVNGYYPDYTAGPYVNKRTAAPMKIRRVPMDKTGRPTFNMYGFDGLWLTQWNLNILWGLAWPEVLDDLSACLIQYADNGGLLPRGACSGGYSFIMTGCPATNMLVSTYMKDLMKKTKPSHAYEAIKRNHAPGGMMSYESADDLKFYVKKGYCPGNAGKTLEWAFQDWGLSRMALRMGKKSDAVLYEKRSRAWTPLFNKNIGLILPKKENGEWLHTDPLNGQGWVEANAWQATWSVSHDLPKLVELMGGGDAFCEKLNYAFEQARPTDFVHAYSGGYVSYANQPGCSNAHLFTYGGQPWLTQYWVRQVKEHAYGGITPDKGYGGHDEDEGQMGAVSALMSLGVFSVTGTEYDIPYYDITSPIFDKITIKLNKDYYSGDEFVINVHNNSADNCYIQKAELNGTDWIYAQLDHVDFAKGGTLDLWLGNMPNKSWGKLKYLGFKTNK